MTKYIRLFKKGMYRFCMMFLLILISSGCNVKEIETQTQTETNNQYAVQEPEMTVIDGINYMMVPKNLLLTNHISHILNIPLLTLMKKLNGLKI